MIIRSGVDEAGRGPVIGPLVLGIVTLDQEGQDHLKSLGVRDSKKISAPRRRTLEPEIKKTSIEWKLLKIQPADIDRLRKTMSLNVIEAVKTAELILSLETTPNKIFIDATDNISDNYKKKIVDRIQELNQDYKLPEIVCEHKADDKYVPASAASVLAKVERDRDIEKLKAEYGDIGSGYPSDEVTQVFLKKLIRAGSLPSFVRRSWKTVEKSRQAALTDY